ncbi:MAG: hypothetical protein PHI27_12150 [Eubacteriales bacterium]|nr:hypothetical protein [Eubacteriales bacterium]MDD3882976.1 hypothetical protein [Eubacteriales bacterium]MDD4513477.1 hypothetical protein [Eubacteriales bacterium]
MSLRDAEPYYAFGVLLFITSQHSRFAKEEWFADAMRRWSETQFIPLASGKPFL